MRASVARAGGKPFAVLTRPRIALPVWLVGWYAIHLALFYDFALEHAWTLNIEHLLLIAMGLIFWWPVLADEPADIGAREDRLPRGLRRRDVPRPRADLRLDAVLRLLRRGPALGDLRRATRTSAASS